MRAPTKTRDRARSLRRAMTLPEVVLWYHLRNARLAGTHIRRQHPLGPYILDFYCAAVKLSIEVDGFAHDNAASQAHDTRRTEWLAQQGVRVLRIRAADILDDESLEGVLIEIEQALGAPSGSLRSPPPPPCGGGSDA